MRRAFVTGVAGQDGSYMADFLLNKGYKVFGFVQKKDPGLENIRPEVNILFGDLKDIESIRLAIKEANLDEIYNFAGISDLKTAFAFPEETMMINYHGVGKLLDEALGINPKVRFLQASSSEIFMPSDKPINESSGLAWSTENPYAKAKMMADRDFIQGYRSSKNIFACSSILFNHESPRRPDKFVTRKITKTLAKIKNGLEDCLLLGNLEAQRDWGFAGDYVEAMWKMLQLDKPEDFVIATGQTHSIREFIETTCDKLAIKISWEGEGIDARATENGRIIVKIDPAFYKPTEKYPKVGDISKAKKLLEWEPRTSFEQLVEMMVNADLEGLNKR